MSPWTFCLLTLAAPQPPAAAEYCVVDAAGNLTIDGRRVRFWGAIGAFPGKQETIAGDPYFRQKQAVRRMKRVGFNLNRIWHVEFDDQAQRGDLSATDVSDFFIDECGRQGVRLWAAGFGGGSLYEADLDAAVGIVDDPASAGGWREAVAGMMQVHWWSRDRRAISLLTPAVAWDPRLEALAVAGMKQRALHRNLHNGLRHADNPVFAVWELTNEQWWMSHMTGGQWQQLPPFFRASLLARWHQWLARKYGDQEGLTRAWGFLFPGEDLDRGTVLLAPMSQPTEPARLNDTNPAAVEVFRDRRNPIGRDDCTTARGNDVIAFLLELILTHKQRWAAELKSWGVSCARSPLIYDTGIGQSIQAQYLHQHADAVAHASYMEGIELGALPRDARRWPFYSGLDLPPQMSKDVPWLEHNRYPGKPFLCYETQFGSPSKYRAEWPMRLVALAAIQDWSAACWHYWSFNAYDFAKDEPYSGHLSFPGNGAYQYDYTHDEVEQATMRAAGAILKGGLLDWAPTPTTFRFGLPALLDPRAMEYAGDYGRTGLMDMMTTAHARGMRLIIDPTQREFLLTDGPVVRFNGFERSGLVRPTTQIEYDIQRGHLRFDAPGVASYTGFLGQYGDDVVRFDNGVRLADVRHLDPPGTPYPAGDERFCSFSLASEDGRPLGECRQAVLVLVASSFNSGLTIAAQPDGSIDFQHGEAPVLVTRVGATVVAPAVAGMGYRMIDFNERVLAEGTVPADGRLVIPADRPVWVTELTRP